MSATDRTAGGDAGRWDAIVIGSGIGGLAAAAALAHEGRKVLVLERHDRAGGLTQGFERDGYRFDVGVHSVGGAGAVDGHDGPVKKLFDRLTPQGIAMAPLGDPFERVRLPGLTFDYVHPAARLQQALVDRFPAEADGIARYFQTLTSARKALEAVFAAQAMPQLLAKGLLWAKQDDIDRWVGRTTLEVVHEHVSDPALRAVLMAQWPDYGGRPGQAAFAIHAVVVSSYLDGGWYPVGGSGAFAREFGAAIAAAGGAIRTGAEVTAIRVAGGRAVGVTLADGTQIDADNVVSDAGIRRTLRLLPSEDVHYEWARDALAIEPSVGYVGLYIGLQGDIAAHGASPANEWIYASTEVDRLWTDPQGGAEAPVLFCSFPSLKDPLWDPGPERRHMCEIVALIDADAFKAWEHEDMHPGEARPEGYQALKDRVERHLLAQFERHYPQLAPMVRMVACSTPVSLATITGAEHGAMYGLQVTPERFLSKALRPRTPLPGLYLAGQDACCPGVTGALMGGLMAAIAVEPRLLALLR